MPRKLRYIAEPGTLVESTCRIVQGRMLLRPSRTFNEMIVGTLAVAKRRYGVRIVCAVVLSNHSHLLFEVDSALQLSRFQGYFGSKIAHEIGRATGWREKIWGRRYSSITVSDEPAAQIARLRYLLSHGAKEGVVYSPGDWPGVNSVIALLTGEPLRGTWFDRSREFAAYQRKEDPALGAFATELEVLLEPLPCWRHLPAIERQSRVRSLVEEIEEQTLAMHAKRGTESSGPRGARRVHPHYRPNQTKRSPTPRFHPWDRRQRRRLERAYSEFVAAFRLATERRRAGHHAVGYPEGSFPPAMPFVRPIESLVPG